MDYTLGVEIKDLHGNTRYVPRAHIYEIADSGDSRVISVAVVGTRINYTIMTRESYESIVQKFES